MVSVVCAQSFLNPLFRVVPEIVLLTWTVNKRTPARMFCINAHHHVFRCYGPNHARSRARLSTMFRVFLLVLRPPSLIESPDGSGRRGGSVGGGAAATATQCGRKHVVGTTSRVQHPKSHWAFSVAGGDDMRLSMPACEVNPAIYGSRSMRSILSSLAPYSVVLACVLFT